MSIKHIWKNGEIISYEEAKVGINTHALHYGTSAFEGIRAYSTDNGTAILMLEEHIERLLYSMHSLGMESKFSHSEICQAVVNITRVSGLDSCYIRPIAYYGEGGVGVLPNKDHPVDFVIYCIPMGKYMSSNLLNIKVSKYIRVHPKSSIVDAKIGGHYINSMLASAECVGTNYDESLLLDYEGYVAEGSAMNIFIVKDGEVITTPLGTILAGLTRKLIINIANDLGYVVREEYFKVEDIINADEAFFCGTAAEISPIGSIDGEYLPNHGKVNPITSSIDKVFKDIRKGNLYKETLTYI